MRLSQPFLSRCRCGGSEQPGASLIEAGEKKKRSRRITDNDDDDIGMSQCYVLCTKREAGADECFVESTLGAE